MYPRISAGYTKEVKASCKSKEQSQDLPKQYDELNKNNIETELVDEVPGLHCRRNGQDLQTLLQILERSKHVRLFTYGKFPCVILAQKKKV